MVKNLKINMQEFFEKNGRKTIGFCLLELLVNNKTKKMEKYQKTYLKVVLKIYTVLKI